MLMRFFLPFGKYIEVTYTPRARWGAISYASIWTQVIEWTFSSLTYVSCLGLSLHCALLHLWWVLKLPIFLFCVLFLCSFHSPLFWPQDRTAAACLAHSSSKLSPPSRSSCSRSVSLPPALGLNRIKLPTSAFPTHTGLSLHHLHADRLYIIAYCFLSIVINLDLGEALWTRL